MKGHVYLLEGKADRRCSTRLLQVLGCSLALRGEAWDGAKALADGARSKVLGGVLSFSRLRNIEAVCRGENWTALVIMPVLRGCKGLHLGPSSPPWLTNDLRFL